MWIYIVAFDIKTPLKTVLIKKKRKYLFVFELCYNRTEIHFMVVLLYAYSLYRAKVFFFFFFLELDEMHGT